MMPRSIAALTSDIASIIIIVAIVVLTLVYGIIGCRPSVPPPPGGVDCVAACVHLREDLKCHGVVNGDPSPGTAHTACESWRCQTPDSPTRSTCIALAATCEAAAACR